MTEDGSWVIGKLRWSGWGSTIARATGVGSSSSCTPSCSAGKRTNSPARVTLSSPGRVQGNEVYRCFRLTFPSSPNADQHRCLRRQGTLTVYVSVSTTATVQVNDFRSPSGNLICNVGNEERVYCSSQNRPHTVSLELDGSIAVCNGRKCLGPPGPKSTGGAVLGYGQSDTVGPYRCKSARKGVTCTVTRPGKALGKGFLINAASVTRVRG